MLLLLIIIAIVNWSTATIYNTCSNTTLKTAGLNAYGELGIEQGDYVLSPIAINAPALTNKFIVQVSAGGYHTLIRTYDNLLFAFGANSNASPLSGAILGGGSSTITSSITQVVNTGALLGITITDIACGMYHNLVLGSNGQIFSWGYNGRGELGVGDTSTRNTPTLISSITSKNISQISAGNQFSLALSSDNIIYAFGANNYGQLGVGDYTDKSTPTIVSITNISNRTITGISASKMGGHAMILTSDGNIFGMGLNSYMNLGDKTTLNRNIPVIATMCDLFGYAGTPVFIRACDIYSLVYTTSGTVYGFGEYMDGNMGTGSALSMGTSTLYACPYPADMSGSLAVNQIADVQCNMQTIYLSSQGILYNSGPNLASAYSSSRRGGLGTGSPNTEFSPALVDTSGILKVCSFLFGS
jgi:alpha-tubulin suppressor-like RCC1 family protein